MCSGGSSMSSTKKKPVLMASVESFSSDDGTPPSKFSTFFTVAVVISMMIAMEQLLRIVFFSYQDLHPLLGEEYNRFVLARHLGVDALSCAAVALLGWKSRSVCQDMTSRVLRRTNSMPDAGYEQRLFSYHPAAFRIALVFFAYQLKNLADTIVWGDGPEYIFHHVLSMTAAYIAMYPGFGHFYVIFFLGVSEISTAILCILANFDNDHGVPGLGEAFPNHKVAIGVCFVVAFFVCRVFMWPIAGYFCTRDCTLALQGDSPHAKSRRAVIHAIKICLTGLSVLQVVFLVQLFIIAKQELAAIGII